MIASAITLELANLFAVVVVGETATTSDVVKAVFTLDDVCEFDAFTKAPIDRYTPSTTVVLVMWHVPNLQY